MNLPHQLLESLAGINGFDKEAFEKVHASGEQATSIRINPAKHFALRTLNFELFPVPWSDTGFYLTSRPSFTFDPLFHAGCYYVQEASSMFLEQALKQTVDLSQNLKVLDLCAAPGGKSTHIQSLISTGSLLVSNEVIKSRNNILADNIIKWGCNNATVTQNDPKEFAQLENYFDVIVADAPCSGSGLFRRDAEAIKEWSINNVQLCCQRQQRIIADVWPALKKDGVLIYSTCSYSKDENEDILDWLAEKFSVNSLRLAINNEWGIAEVQSEKHHAYGYRFFPDKVKGEGFFIACFQKTDGAEFHSLKPKQKMELLNKKERAIAAEWINNEQMLFIKYKGIACAVPVELAEEVNRLAAFNRIIYFGTAIGELIRDKMIPHHALAISSLLADKIKRIELDYAQAIKYLQKKEVALETKTPGWHLATFQHHPLGWVNVLQNRINNYYPKALRILKDTE